MSSRRVLIKGLLVADLEQAAEVMAPFQETSKILSIAHQIKGNIIDWGELQSWLDRCQ